MEIKAIPTVYGGVQFRSRLEARWAAFFDLLGWEWEYEPFDLRGWIPDFLLRTPVAEATYGGLPAGVLVEVKPCSSFPCPIAEEIDRAIPPEFEAMIVGLRVPVPSSVETSDGYAIGWLRCNPAGWREDLSPKWGGAICQRFVDSEAFDSDEIVHDGDAFGLYGSCDHEMRGDRGSETNIHQNWSLCLDRIGGHGRKYVDWALTDFPRVGPFGDLDGRGFKCKLLPLWREAGNRVQWRSPRREDA